MKLIPVDPANEEHLRVLYDLLAERTPEQSISHREMPTWDEHAAFVKRMASHNVLILEDDDFRLGEPRYQGWFLVENYLGAVVGSVYLTGQRNEIGISIFRRFQKRGYGQEAVTLLVQKYGPAKYLANINPANEPSRKMFEKLGFRVIQHTLMLEAK